MLSSAVENKFRALGWKIIWTPPYCPEFQPIELVWGAGKQRAASLYFPGRNLKQTRLDLRKGFYGCDTDSPRSDWQGKKWGIVNVAGCWRTAEGEINRWISNDRAHVADGLAGTVTELQGAEAWTKTAADCLDIGDMELDVEPALEPNMAVPHITADDEAEELEEVLGGGGSEE